MCCSFLCRSFSLSFKSFSSNQAVTLDFLSTGPPPSSLLTLSPSAILCNSRVTTSVLHPVGLGCLFRVSAPHPTATLGGRSGSLLSGYRSCSACRAKRGKRLGVCNPCTNEFSSLWVEEAGRCKSFFRVPLGDQAAACPLWGFAQGHMSGTFSSLIILPRSTVSINNLHTTHHLRV